MQEMDHIPNSHFVSNDHFSSISQNVRVPPGSNILSSIHINPSLHTSRNIYINKALYYNNEDQKLVKTLPNKSERIYYNPKFFKNHKDITEIEMPPCQNNLNKDLPKKQETNIYLNPRFIKNVSINGANSVKQECPALPSGTFETTMHRTGIHFNPKFIQEHVSKPEKNDYPCLSNETIVNPVSKENDLNQKNSLQNQYVSKYKIIRKEPNSSESIHSKNNIKKANFIPVVKNRYKLNRVKSINYDPYTVDKYTSKKYYCEKTALLSTRKWTSPKSILKFKENVTPPDIRIFRVNRKMSLLQHKIQARRRGMSSFASNCYRYQVLSSKYKDKKTLGTSQKYFRLSKSHYIKHHYHKSNKKTFNNEITCDKSVFKSINKLKLVRKSVLQAQIELRHFAKKSLLQLQRVPIRNEGLISKHKIDRSSKRSPLSVKNAIRSKKNPMKFSSKNYRTDKLRRLHNLTKKLRKNNEPCPFFNRYGRCKGKDKGSCPKLHDLKYISICKKFLKGECKEEICTLSHDIRPEKMPTCHHYLAGLCKRKNCPYLHIKVNQKAPICRSFLQGFCADVFNCNKRHEFICPAFAEKGHCSKGKSCSLPHRTPKMYSKLLEPDQFPLLNTNVKKKCLHSEVSKTGCHSAHNEKISENCENVKKKKVYDKKKRGNEFQRYFLTPLEPINDPNDKDDNDDDR